MNIGDKVRIRPGSEYDEGSQVLYGEFSGLEGVIVREGYDVPVTPGTEPLFHVEIHSSNPHILEDNPWPFYARELELHA